MRLLRNTKPIKIIQKTTNIKFMLESVFMGSFLSVFKNDWFKSTKRVLSLYVVF